jgi:membrane protease subunit HflC
MKPLFIKLLIGAGVALFILFQSTFVVLQTQQVLVVQFGEIVRVIQKPGLNFKIPFIQNVLTFDKRLLDFRTRAGEFITYNRDIDVEERVVIDGFVRYKITNPVQFYQAVKNEANLASRLNSIVLANMRKTLANYSLSDLLSDKRAEIMDVIRRQVNQQANVARVAPEDGSTAKVGAHGSGFGIEVVDLRIVRADLPADISQSTYERMRQNFTKEALRFRAEGEERALQITANADREKVEIIAEAQKKAEILRGEGDGEAANIYANAFKRDPKFFQFYRSMQAYRKTLGSDSTTIILSPDSEFLKELNP